MTEEEMIFLANVRVVCRNNPNMLSAMIETGLGGIKSQIQEERDRANDMEIVASTMMGLALEKGRVSAKMKETFEKLAFNKIDNWKSKSSLNWDGYKYNET